MLKTLQIPKRDVCEKPSQGFLLCPAIKNTSKQNLCLCLTITILVRVPNVSFSCNAIKGWPRVWNSGIPEFGYPVWQAEQLKQLCDWRMGLYSSAGDRIEEQFVCLLLYLWNRPMGGNMEWQLQVHRNNRDHPTLQA